MYAVISVSAPLAEHSVSLSPLTPCTTDRRLTAFTMLMETLCLCRSETFRQEAAEDQADVFCSQQPRHEIPTLVWLVREWGRRHMWLNVVRMWFLPESWWWWLFNHEENNWHDPTPLTDIIRLWLLLLFKYEWDPQRQNLHFVCLTLNSEVEILIIID